MYEQYIAALKEANIFYTYLVDEFIEQLKNNIVFFKRKD